MSRFVVFGLLLAGAGLGVTQQSTDCSPWQRRADAIRLARNVNTLESRARVQSNRYVGLPDLGLATSDGFEIELSTDGERYSFSVKDKTDPCHRAVFSDQVGVIYVAEPLK